MDDQMQINWNTICYILSELETTKMCMKLVPHSLDERNAHSEKSVNIPCRPVKPMIKMRTYVFSEVAPCLIPNNTSILNAYSTTQCTLLYVSIAASAGNWWD